MTTHKEAFKTLTVAWQSGQPIIPLFGSGLSVGAGIPWIGPMEEYLAKVLWYFSVQIGRRSVGLLLNPHEISGQLLREGWPKPHELNTSILRQWESLRPEAKKQWWGDLTRSGGPEEPATRARDLFPRIVDHVFNGCDQAGRKNRWRWLLKELCDENQDLKDRYFEQFERGRRPAVAHQFAAFLAGLMGWDLILTTNFDSLLEEALRAQALYPTVYELLEQGPVPDPDSVKSHFAMVKLHGGAFNRRMSDSLDDPLPETVRNRLVGYFPPNSVVLVLGYSGGDRRVMSFLEAMVNQEVQEPDVQASGVRLLWVHREQEVHENVKHLCQQFPTKVQTVCYRNGGRFLQELFCRLVYTHPVSTTHYRAYPHMPPETTRGDIGNLPSLAEPVMVIRTAAAGSGTSTCLAKVAQSLCRQHEIIWCDLETLPTVDALVDYLQNRFRRFDPDLPPFAHFQTEDQSLSARRSDTDPRIKYIVEAMQRGKYFVAIDSIGEFGTSVLAYAEPNGKSFQNEIDRVIRQVQRLHDFLRGLIAKRDEFGESRLGIAITDLDTGNGDANAKAKIASDCFHEFVDCEKQRGGLTIKPTDFTASDSDTKPQASEFGLQYGVATRILRLTPAELDELRVTDLEGKVTSLWDLLDKRSPTHKWFLAFASCFRRRRDIVGIHKLLMPLMAAERGLPGERPIQFRTVTDAFERIAMPAFQDWTLEDAKSVREKIELTLDDLNDLGLLVRQEGGFYWMHRVIRNRIYKFVRAAADRETLAEIHNVIATFSYEELFRPSNDPAAMFEYLFQRVLSISCTREEKKRMHWLLDLAAVLDRDRDRLLKDTHPGVLGYYIQLCWWLALNDEARSGVQSEEYSLLEAEIQRKRIDLQKRTKAHHNKAPAHPASPNSKIVLAWQRKIERLNQEADALKEEELPIKAGQAEGELRRVLCELEAESLRQASLFQACISVRLRQIKHRMERVIPKEDRARDKALITDLGGQLSQGVVGRAEHAVELIKRCSNAIFPHVQHQEHAETHKEGVRFFDHLIDMAACATGAGDRKLATKLLESIPDSLRQLGALSRSTAAHVRDVRVRYVFRRMEASLRTISPWNKQNRKEEDNELLKQVIVEFREGEGCLGEFSGWLDRRYEHYVCCLNTLRARAAYLMKDFLHAYKFLDAARSAVRRPVRSSEHSANAIILLHQAECLMLHADYNLTGAIQGNPTSDSGSVRASAGRARAKLKRAHTSLKHARTLLEAGRPHVWAWTWLRVLEAQLWHEFFLWSFDHKRSHRGERERQTMVQRGLHAIRIGLDSSGKDAHRKKELTILWWQFFLHSQSPVGCRTGCSG